MINIKGEIVYLGKAAPADKSSISKQVTEHNVSPQAHEDIRAAVNALNLIKWVETLPAIGESKYIYAVPREETDTDGKPIAALYLWDGTRWNGVGAFSLNIDPDTLAKKTDLTKYLHLTGGTLSGDIAINNEQSKFGTNLNGWKAYFITKKGNYPSFYLGNDEGLTKWTALTRMPSGRLNVGFSSNSTEKVLSVNSSPVLVNSDKSVANGVASLDANAKVPSEQIPVATASTLGGVKLEFDETTGTLNIKTE